jgi:hypothetical protein
MLGSSGTAVLLLGTVLLAPGCTKNRDASVGAGGRATTDGASLGGRRAAATTTPEPRDQRPRPGPNACLGINSACTLLSEFPPRDGAWWGDGDDLHGGLALLGTGLTRTSDASALHLRGTVAGGGVGFALWFDHCTDLANYAGLRFILSGALKGAPSRRMQVAVQTNSDRSWQTSPPADVGACTPVSPGSAAAECVAPSVAVALTKAPTLIHWADVAGGKPKPWDPETGPREITGVAFTFPWDAKSKPYAVDITFDDFGFISAAPLPCSVLPVPSMSP